jgi:Uma2 family endonuclease
MSTVLTEPHVGTLADLLHELGDIDPGRVLLQPPPGTATEEDLLRLPPDLQQVTELVDGTLVVKAMGAPESWLQNLFVAFLAQHRELFRKLVILGPDGHTRYFGNNVRMPDIAVFLRSQLPDGKLPRQPICPVPPQLAIEVLSRGNTRGEMDKKRRLFFESGVKYVWEIDPRRRTAVVFTSPDDFTELGEEGRLECPEVLPGFALTLREWLDAAE